MDEGRGQRLDDRKVDSESRREAVERWDGKLDSRILQTRAST